jgi:N-ethylmaleimide reductase
MPTLFDPLGVGMMRLKNRIVMAPLTRGRAGESRIPNALMAEYYGQRAGAGLIVTEATAISAEGYGWMNAPAMYTDAHQKGWRLTTDAVHKGHGNIVLQLWHMGRVSHPDFLEGNLPVAPSAIAAPGMSRGAGGKKPYVTPRAMTKDDIKRTIADYAAAAKRAMRAGFDGVEIHGANGYLIDQFLRDGSNTRTDEYGGSIINRVRFLKEVAEAVMDAVGADRIGLRLSPINDAPGNPMTDSDLPGLYKEVAREMENLRLAYLHVREIWKDGTGAVKPLAVTPLIRDIYTGAMIVNDSYDPQTGSEIVKKGLADAVAFGKPFIANPDLVERLRAGAPLNEPDPETFYTSDAKGYTDYPVMPASKGVQQA